MARQNLKIFFGTKLFRNKEKGLFSKYFGTLINKRKAENMGQTRLNMLFSTKLPVKANKMGKLNARHS